MSLQRIFRRLGYLSRIARGDYNGLIEKLGRDLSPSKCDEAVVALESISHEINVDLLRSIAVEPLSEKLKDPDVKVRRQAAQSLGKIGDTRASQVLVAALKDEDEIVRGSAVWALGELGAASVSTPTELEPGEYLRRRVQYKIDLYHDLGEGEENWYKRTSLWAIILAALVPVLVNTAFNLQIRGISIDNSVLATLASLAVTILVGAEKLYLFREHWRNYDLAEESLNREKYQYQARAGEYTGRFDEKGRFVPLTDVQAYQLFVSRCEAIIHGEREKTIVTRTKEGAPVKPG